MEQKRAAEIDVTTPTDSKISKKEHEKINTRVGRSKCGGSEGGPHGEEH